MPLLLKKPHLDTVSAWLGKCAPDPCRLCERFIVRPELESWCQWAVENSFVCRLIDNKNVSRKLAGTRHSREA